MTEGHWVYARWFLRGVAARLSWGEDPEYDEKILSELAEIAREPAEKIRRAAMLVAAEEYCAAQVEGNETVH